jgi:DNA-binding CsgD family transcriptional regulator
MITQFNAWFQKATTNLILKNFLKTWGEVYSDVPPADASEYLKSTKIFDLMSNRKKTIFLLFDVKEFKILYCSDNFEKMTGHPTSEIMTRNVGFFFEILKRKDILFFFEFTKWLTSFNKSVPVEYLQEYLQIQWFGMTVRKKDDTYIETLFKIDPFERHSNGLSRLCIITLEDVTSLVRKDASYWSRMEAGSSKKFYSSFFEDNPRFVMKDIISEREMEVLKLIAEGYDSKDIGDKLFLSTHTIDRHRKNMIARLGAKDSTALIEMCRMCDLI